MNDRGKCFLNSVTAIILLKFWLMKNLVQYMCKIVCLRGQTIGIYMLFLEAHDVQCSICHVINNVHVYVKVGFELCFVWHIFSEWYTSFWAQISLFLVEILSNFVRWLCFTIDDYRKRIIAWLRCFSSHQLMPCRTICRGMERMGRNHPHPQHQPIRREGQGYLPWGFHQLKK